MVLTLTIADDAAGTRIINDYATATRYDPASGLTKAQWFKQSLIDQIKAAAKRGEVRDTAVTISAEIDAIVVT